MNCQLCNENPATVHITEVSPQGTTELHLCEDCMKQHKMDPKGPIPDIFHQHVKQWLAKTQTARGGGDVRCPHCGMTYAIFRAKARLGCPRDYEVFRAGLLPLLEKVHGETQHRGKIPLRAERALARNRELTQLQAMLDRVVKEEAFEKAAELRNRIRRLLDEPTSGGPAT